MGVSTRTVQHRTRVGGLCKCWHLPWGTRATRVCRISISALQNSFETLKSPLSLPHTTRHISLYPILILSTPRSPGPAPAPCFLIFSVTLTLCRLCGSLNKTESSGKCHHQQLAPARLGSCSEVPCDPLIHSCPQHHSAVCWGAYPPVGSRFPAECPQAVRRCRKFSGTAARYHSHLAKPRSLWRRRREAASPHPWPPRLAVAEVPIRSQAKQP